MSFKKITAVILIATLMLVYIPVSIASGAEGTASFELAASYVTGSEPTDITSGDFNGDGKCDIAVVYHDLGVISVMTSKGDGTFNPKVDYGIVGNQHAISTGDFNKDGKLDIVTANGDEDSVSVLIRNEEGTFNTSANYSTGAGSGPIGVAVGDINGDGNLDIVTADHYTNCVSVLLGTGIGTFGASANYTVGNCPVSVAAADFNGDGKLDIAAANYMSNNVSILTGLGGGTFNPKIDYNASSHPSDIAVGDINNDGKPDIVVSNDSSNNITVLTCQEGGTTFLIQNYSTGSYPSGAAIADFNNDGKLDVTTANLHSNSISVLVGPGDGTFISKTDYATGTGPIEIAAGDFNGDGKTDIATADFSSSSISAFINNKLEQTAKPTASPSGGVIMPGTTISLSCSTTDAVVHYTTDGTEPSAGSPVYATPITVNSGMTIKAIAVKPGMANSDVMTETYVIAHTPVINIQPHNAAITAGQSVSFNVTAEGEGLSYQWKKNGTPISGATSSSLGLSNVQAGDSGSYTVSIENPAGAVESDAAVLTVNPMPVSHPHDTVSTGTVSGSIIDNTPGGNALSITATITSGSDGRSMVSMPASQIAVFRTRQGAVSPISDISRFIIETSSGSVISVSSDGTLRIQNLTNGTDNNFNIYYDLGSGKKIIIGRMFINIQSCSKANLTCSLIDPYGIITDSNTGMVIEGADVTLYYADTNRNRTSGKKPDTVVELPGINGFKPNDNANPQKSDVYGAYGFMVYPDTDYYVTAKKDGCQLYKSPIIVVDKEIVKWDFRMNKAEKGIKRLSGLNRIDTSIEIAKAGYTGKIKNVIIAADDSYSDALSGSVLAYKLNAPILLAGKRDPDLQKIIDYMKLNMDTSGKVYILGGTGAVGSSVETKISAAGFTNITRLGGADRYETSAKIAESLNLAEGSAVALVNGSSYTDALSISSEAAVFGMPILLVDNEKLNTAVKNEISKLKPSKIYAIGFKESIKDSILEEAVSVSGSKAIRIFGKDKYDTSVEAAKYFGFSAQSVCIATGNNFPDALSGSVYAANHNAPVILVDSSLSANAAAYMKSGEASSAAIFGGEGAVGKSIEKQILQNISR